MAAPVNLHLYDLTQGMASALSPMLLGKHIAGIWHSGLVVHGREYFFGYGISSTASGCSPFGQPDMVICLGQTEVPQDMVDSLIDDLRPRFSPQDYNLIHHNCNHFTSELSQLLTGDDIPDFVRSQAQEVLETPLGRQFAPMILQLEGITSQAHAAGFGPAGHVAGTSAATAAAAAVKAAAATAPTPAGAAAGAEAAAPASQVASGATEVAGLSRSAEGTAASGAGAASVAAAPPAMQEAAAGTDDSGHLGQRIKDLNFGSEADDHLMN